MADPKINNLEDFENFIQEMARKWTADQRTLFAAAMAERWLPVYRAFSEAEAWDDPDSLQHGLEAVWDHLRGRRRLMNIKY